MSDIYQKLLNAPAQNLFKHNTNWLKQLNRIYDDEKTWKLKTCLRIIQAPYICLIKNYDLFLLIKEGKVYLISESITRMVTDEEYATIKSITSGIILFQRNTFSEFDLGGVPEEIKELISIVDALELIGLDDV